VRYEAVADYKASMSMLDLPADPAAVGGAGEKLYCYPVPVQPAKGGGAAAATKGHCQVRVYVFMRAGCCGGLGVGELQSA